MLLSKLGEYREAYGDDDISALNYTVLGPSERRHFGNEKERQYVRSFTFLGNNSSCHQLGHFVDYIHEVNRFATIEDVQMFS